MANESFRGGLSVEPALSVLAHWSMADEAYRNAYRKAYGADDYFSGVAPQLPLQFPAPAQPEASQQSNELLGAPSQKRNRAEE